MKNTSQEKKIFAISCVCKESLTVGNFRHKSVAEATIFPQYFFSAFDYIKETLD